MNKQFIKFIFFSVTLVSILSPAYAYKKNTRHIIQQKQKVSTEMVFSQNLKILSSLVSNDVQCNFVSLKSFDVNEFSANKCYINEHRLLFNSNDTVNEQKLMSIVCSPKYIQYSNECNRVDVETISPECSCQIVNSMKLNDSCYEIRSILTKDIFNINQSYLYPKNIQRNDFDIDVEEDCLFVKSIKFEKLYDSTIFSLYKDVFNTNPTDLSLNMICEYSKSIGVEEINFVGAGVLVPSFGFYDAVQAINMKPKKTIECETITDISLPHEKYLVSHQANVQVIQPTMRNLNLVDMTKMFYDHLFNVSKDSMLYGICNKIIENDKNGISNKELLVKYLELYKNRSDVQTHTKVLIGKNNKKRIILNFNTLIK